MSGLSAGLPSFFSSAARSGLATAVRTMTRDQRGREVMSSTPGARVGARGCRTTETAQKWVSVAAMGNVVKPAGCQARLGFDSVPDPGLAGCLARRSARWARRAPPVLLMPPRLLREHAGHQVVYRGILVGQDDRRPTTQELLQPVSLQLVR